MCQNQSERRRLSCRTFSEFAVFDRRGIAMPAVSSVTREGEPYRRVANPWKLSRQSMAATASLAVTHPPRKSRRLPHEKPAPQFCLRFVATKSHDVNARRGPFSTTRPKRLSRLRISHHIARHARRAASPHATQVLQAMMDFAACESARHVMRIKCLKRRAFSL
jgi:hypothetical protein